MTCATLRAPACGPAGWRSTTSLEGDHDVKLGMVGLGRMGGNMAERLRGAGHEVVGYDRIQRRVRRRRRSPTSSSALGDAAAGGVGDGARRATRPRQVVNELGRAPRPGRRRRRRRQLELPRLDAPRRRRWPSAGIGFVDAGTSGGVWGLDNGYCLMVGGDDEHVAIAQPVFDALAPADGGFAHVGPVGAGHYTKMVHNGIEYGLMQAYAEGYALLPRVRPRHRRRWPRSKAWQHGSVVRSWLLDLLVRALRADPGLEGIAAVRRRLRRGPLDGQRGGAPRRRRARSSPPRCSPGSSRSRRTRSP